MSLRESIANSSPRPWALREVREDEDHFHIDDVNGSPIALVEPGECDGDAALIVAVVNRLDRMLGVIDEAEKEAQSHLDEGYYNCGCSLCTAVRAYQSEEIR